MAYDPFAQPGDIYDPFQQRQWEEEGRQQQRALMRQFAQQNAPLPKTIGSARVIDGTLKLMFTDGTRIDIPMAVVSEIVAVVLAGRLAMGLSEAEPPADPR